MQTPFSQSLLRGDIERQTIRNSFKPVYPMISDEALERLVGRFERIQSRNLDTQKHSRESLAHQIDEYLMQYQPNPTPRHYLEKAQRALSKCNLPLTMCIFRQEAQLVEQRHPKGCLELSPSVAISILAQKRKVRSVATEFDSIDHAKAERLTNQVIGSLEMIRDDIADIAERHTKHKMKKRAVQQILRGRY